MFMRENDCMKESNFSVLMSIYNKDNSEFLKEALESLKNQTIRAKETIIIFDGIVDKSLYDTVQQYVEELNIVTIQNEVNIGLAKSLNKGLTLVKYDLVARMDADDIATRDRFQKQLAVFQGENLQVDIVGGYVQEFSDNLRNLQAIRKVPQIESEIKEFSKYRSPLNHPTVMMRTQVVLSVGGYPTQFNKLEDYALWVYLINQNQHIINIPEILTYMRVSDSTYMRRGGVEQAKAFVMLRTKMFHIGYINLLEMCFGTFINVSMSVMPKKMRCIIYKILRR
ncbi:glycosyltransferase [Leuconostoc citreum]|nr:glycosyltransferase [Leuconostoc citreum]MCT3061450.1 glycosyltransferase [Leuconostoc citreum]